MWSNILTTKEADFTKKAIEALKGVEWVRPVLSRLEQAGGLISENMPLMFEVRFAYELHRSGVVAEYEYSAEVGDSTVEFRILGAVTWLIELVSIRTSQAAKKSITRNGSFYEQVLRTDAVDIAQTPEAEMITAEQKIGEKVFANGVPIKFPKPSRNVYHVILADMRGYLDEGGDIYDYRQIVYGQDGIPSDKSWRTHYWKTGNGRREPIKGLFEKSCPLRAASYIQERIHFIGFVKEREYQEDEIKDKAYYLPNSNLVTNDEVGRLYEAFPLKITSYNKSLEKTTGKC